MQRVGAAVVDFFVRLAIALPAIVLGALLFDRPEDGIVYGGLIGQILALPYEPLMMARTGGQTVGHRASGTRIVLADGRPIDGRRAFNREVLVKWLLFEAFGGLLFGIPTLLNYLWPLWDDRDEALHDKLCGTRVVTA